MLFAWLRLVSGGVSFGQKKIIPYSEGTMEGKSMFR
ncbi:hypothetical protein SAMN05444972_10425 [Marininema halotolerans]|uniref:Uncharacterized protein n=1 Tax=Marininema halotolerans TaxID=1155944 RepID=A0A1I6R1K5_9BACL|nr:hypothetical protein SAMN05444972_10425 [Marininema halotolerans]